MRRGSARALQTALPRWHRACNSDRAMKPKRSLVASVAAGLGLALVAPASPSASARQTPAGSQVAATQPAVSPKHKAAFDAFEARVKEYVALRESIDNKMPKLSKEAKPEEIEAH